MNLDTQIMNKIYTIYHIPEFVYSDGSIGKIGVSHRLTGRIKQNLKKSLEGFTKWEVLEEHDCKYEVSDREIELQKQYGYKVDTIPYWKTINNPTKEGRRKGGYNLHKRYPNLASELGKVNGKKNAEAGNMFIMANAAKKVNRKPIIQYDKEGNFIKEWEGLNVAQIELGIQNIYTSIPYNGTRGGYVWLYKDTPMDKEKLAKYFNQRGNSVAILQYDKNGNLIKEWDKIIDAADKLGLHAQNINRVLKGRCKTTGGFVFKYK